MFGFCCWSTPTAEIDAVIVLSKSKRTNSSGSVGSGPTVPIVSPPPVGFPAGVLGGAS